MPPPASPAPAVVSASLVGDSTALLPVHWDERDLMLYALGVGAGQGTPEAELEFTTENSEGRPFKALPGFLNALTTERVPPKVEAMDKGPFLHAEHELEMIRPLPTHGPGFFRSRVEQVLDKGRDALLVVVSELFADAAGETLIGRTRATMFVRGAGGFGGERGAASPWSLPDRPAEHVRRQRTRPEQALIYRLSGDRHRLHSDPLFARGHGFERPILHGLCTFGYGCRNLAAVLCPDDPHRLARVRGRFARPGFPGDELNTEVWLSAPSRALFRIVDGAGQVIIDRGEADLR